ncbi:hypothetical protein BF95_09095 [Sphingobium sp. Ant17]|nr:hypothetical protein BF95_09095 [Sphingobium sp. Ant17]
MPDKLDCVLEVITLAEDETNFDGSFRGDIEMHLEGAAAIVAGRILAVAQIPVEQAERSGRVGNNTVEIAA